MLHPKRAILKTFASFASSKAKGDFPNYAFYNSAICWYKFSCYIGEAIKLKERVLIEAPEENIQFQIKLKVLARQRLYFYKGMFNNSFNFYQIYIVGQVII